VRGREELAAAFLYILRAEIGWEVKKKPTNKQQ
jgi:hypothetical protein